jgi:cytochrome P450
MLARRELVVALTKLLSRLDNLRIVPEGSDLGRAPSVMMRATKALRIAFDRGIKRPRGTGSGASPL